MPIIINARDTTIPLQSANGKNPDVFSLPCLLTSEKVLCTKYISQIPKIIAIFPHNYSTIIVPQESVIFKIYDNFSLFSY